MPNHPLNDGATYFNLTGAELLEKWKEVVDEATAMRKLKSVLNYRRKAAEMRERAKENSGEQTFACKRETHAKHAT